MCMVGITKVVSPNSPRNEQEVDYRLIEAGDKDRQRHTGEKHQRTDEPNMRDNGTRKTRYSTVV